MAEGMSRREWWSVIGGLLGVFGLGHLQKPAPHPLPSVIPKRPAVGYSSYLGGTGFPRAQVMTYTYDPGNQLVSWSGACMHLPGVVAACRYSRHSL
jgi:hypothetical protein